MLTCLVVDDEPSAIDLLRLFIADTPFLTLVGSATNPVEALAFLQRQPVDVLFLDINLPQLSGLDLMRLVPAPTKVILTTAYSEFAVAGFNLNALDYLLKPIAFERFLQAARKAIPAPASLLPPAEDYFFVKTEGRGRLVKISFNELLYVEGLKNYVALQTADERIVTLLTIKDLESRLPARHFMRVHKSFIVALPKIQALDGNQILFKGVKATVPLGDTYRAAFFDALQQKLMGGKK